MALTLQRKLELAGDLSRVQPLLRRLHVVEKPKQRHHVRNVILASSVIAAGVAVLVVGGHRLGCKKDAAVLNIDNGGADETEISEWSPAHGEEVMEGSVGEQRIGER